jgi:hypothetical protein
MLGKHMTDLVTQYRGQLVLISANALGFSSLNTTTSQLVLLSGNSSVMAVATQRT